MRTHFPEQIQFKAPAGFMSALAAAARREHTSASEFLRRCVIPHLPNLGAHTVTESSDQRQREVG
jgi:hypothetical protein